MHNDKAINVGLEDNIAENQDEACENVGLEVCSIAASKGSGANYILGSRHRCFW